MSTQDVKISEVESRSREGLEIDLAWLAGLIDGEGNINCGFFSNQLKRSTGSKHDGSYQVLRIDCVITNTHADAIEKATKILAEIGVKFRVMLRDRKRGVWQPCFVVAITGQKNSTNLLRAILKHLTVKRETAKQAILVYEYRQTLARAWNNQFRNDQPLLQDDPVLKGMIQQARHLVRHRPNALGFSLVSSVPLKLKKPSTTIRSTALSADEVRAQLQKI